MFEQTKKDQAQINFSNAQTGNMLFAQGITYKFTEFGEIDWSTLVYPKVPPPQKVPLETPKSKPENYVEQPGTKPIVDVPNKE